MAYPFFLFQKQHRTCHRNICRWVCSIILLPLTREVPLFLCFHSSKFCGKIMLAIILSIEKISVQTIWRNWIYFWGVGKGRGFLRMKIRVSRGFFSGPCTCNEVFKRWFEMPLDCSNCCLMSSGQPLFTICKWNWRCWDSWVDNCKYIALLLSIKLLLPIKK